MGFTPVDPAPRCGCFRDRKRFTSRRNMLKESDLAEIHGFIGSFKRWKGVHWKMGWCASWKIPSIDGWFGVPPFLGNLQMKMAALAWLGCLSLVSLFGFCWSRKKLIIWLVVWTPLKNISQLGWLFPIYGKIKHVPNHQPVIVGGKKCVSRRFFKIWYHITGRYLSPRYCPWCLTPSPSPGLPNTAHRIQDNGPLKSCTCYIHNHVFDNPAGLWPTMLPIFSCESPFFSPLSSGPLTTACHLSALQTCSSRHFFWAFSLPSFSWWAKAQVSDTMGTSGGMSWVKPW